MWWPILSRSDNVWTFYENVNQDNDEANAVGLRVKMADTKKTVQPPLTLKALQAAVDRWIKTYGVRYFTEMTNLAVLMEEVGELARIISRTYGEQSFKGKNSPTDLGDELADVLFVLICIANQTGVELDAAMSKNLQKKTARDHRRHHDNPKLAP
jgi:NTP pyrophosphatase (non-canonical NTP hydrolase)